MDEKIRKWRKLEEQAHTLTDDMGCPLDTQIITTLIPLWALGFETTGSCEGHINHGKPFPWIWFDVSDTDSKDKWHEINRRKKDDLLKLITQFNKSYSVPNMC